MAKANEKNGNSAGKGRANDATYTIKAPDWSTTPTEENEPVEEEEDAMWSPQKIWEKNAKRQSVVRKTGGGEPNGRWLVSAKGVDFCFYRIPAQKFTMGFDVSERLSECREKWRCGEKNTPDFPFCPKKKKPTVCYARSDDEATMRTVKITRDFWLMDTPVTVAAFDVFLRATGRAVPEGAFGYDAETNEIRFDKRFNFANPGFPDFEMSMLKASYPATCVDWSGAFAFCAWLTEEIKNCRRVDVAADETLTFRLPTEAEWEAACRCGTSSAYFFGDDVSRLAEYGNYDGEDGFTFASPVKSFLANDFGLFDMHGNVWEWCSDWYAPYAATWFGSLRNPSGPTYGALRTVRGGSWDNVAEYCRSATRGAAAPSVRAVNLGFRVAMDIHKR